MERRKIQRHMSHQLQIYLKQTTMFKHINWIKTQKIGSQKPQTQLNYKIVLLPLESKLREMDLDKMLKQATLNSG
jgi:hypothetical protein